MATETGKLKWYTEIIRSGYMSCFSGLSLFCVHMQWQKAIFIHLNNNGYSVGQRDLSQKELCKTFFHHFTTLGVTVGLMLYSPVKLYKNLGEKSITWLVFDLEKTQFNSDMTYVQLLHIFIISSYLYSYSQDLIVIQFNYNSIFPLLHII